MNHFFPNQSLHLHIAPEYRSVWFQLRDKYQAKLETQKEIEEKQELKKEKKKKQEEIGQKNELTRMRLAMTERTRRMCNDVFLQLDMPNHDKSQMISISNPVRNKLMKRGFTKQQINDYKKYAPITEQQNLEEQEQILFETLLLYLPENELPEQYKPSAGNFEVFSLPTNQTPDATKQGDQSSESKIVEEVKLFSSLSKYHQKIAEDVISFGFSKTQIAEYLLTSPEENVSVAFVGTELYYKYCLFGVKGSLECDTNDDKTQIIQEEEETLRAVFDDEFIHESIRFEDCEGTQLRFWKLPLHSDDQNIHGSLIVYFTDNGLYPFAEPWIHIDIPELSIEMRQHIIRKLFFNYHDPQAAESSMNSPSFPSPFLQSFDGGSPMIYSILLWLQQYIPEIIQQPISTLSLSENPSKPSLPSKSPESISSNKPSMNYPPQKQKIEKIKKYSEQEINTISEEILKQQTIKQKADQFQKMQKIRSSLPAYKHKEEILELYKNNDILVLSGETGCGKTTQVPQFLLDYFIETKQAGHCNMICTQPRRLSAIGVASRVAKERNEQMEQSDCLVGYHVRLQKQISKSCRLVFCTIAILLRKLQHLAHNNQSNNNNNKSSKQTSSNLMNEYLSSLSCIIIDEVHERSLDCDFLLIILKQFMMHRKANKLHPLKIILMSATISTDSFIHYFKSKNLNVGKYHIPGFTFPVKQFYLPDIIKTIGYLHPENKIKRSGAEKEKYISQLEQELPHESPEIIHSLSLYNQNKIDFSLLQKLIIHIIQNSMNVKANSFTCSDFILQSPKKGSILVFLPGLAEISKLKNKLLQSEVSNQCHIISLHSSIPLDKQQQVFDDPPSGKMKIVLSTNIAETSITIPDVIYVIDTGKAKQMQYDPTTQVNSLQETIISQSSSNQRSGRAGRIQEGISFRLYTHSFFSTKMNLFDTPEIFRIPLHQIYLLTCVFLSGSSSNVLNKLKIHKFLTSAIESPSVDQLNEAENYLISLGALRLMKDHQDSNSIMITPLGCHISKLPVDVRIAKLLIFSTILRCLNPILTICAVLSYHSPFLSPLDCRDEAKQIQQKFKKCKSDHISYHIAYEAYCNDKSKHKFCKDNFISLPTMVMIKKLRKQFIELLADIGFISIDKKHSIILNSNFVNEQQYSMKTIQACLSAGLFPNVLKIQPPIQTFVKLVEGGTIAKPSKSNEFRFFNSERKRIFIHPSSFNFSENSYESVWLVFLKIMETSKLYVYDTTMVYPYPLLLFGSNNISIDQVKNYLIVRILSWFLLEL